MTVEINYVEREKVAEEYAELLRLVKDPANKVLVDSITELWINILPKKYRDESEARYWNVQVSYRGKGKYCVADAFRECVNRKGEWVAESQPSSRTNKFISETRFELAEAIEIALKVAESPRFTRKLSPEEFIEQFILPNLDEDED